MNRQNIIVVKNWQEQILKMDIPQTGIFKTNKMKKINWKPNMSQIEYTTYIAYCHYMNLKPQTR